MSQKETLKSLCGKRQTILLKQASSLHFLNSVSTEIPLEQIIVQNIKARYDKHLETFEHFNKIQIDIETSCTQDNFEAEYTERENFKNNFYSLCKNIRISKC